MTRELTVKQRTYDELAIYHQIAIDMKFYGFQHKDISAYLAGYAAKNGIDLKFSEGLIKQWFSRDGICKFAFDLLKEERSKEREEGFADIQNKLRQAAVEALPALATKAKNGHVLAGIALLKFAGLSEEAKIDIPQEEETEVDLGQLTDAEVEVLLKLQELQNGEATKN
jgi:hypothetical protein